MDPDGPDDPSTPAPPRKKVAVVTAAARTREEVPFVANGALKGQDAVDEYVSSNRARETRPSEEVLEQFERDPRAARLMFHERTGFDLDDATRLITGSLSPDEEIRRQARVELAKAIATRLSVPTCLRRMRFATHSTIKAAILSRRFSAALAAVCETLIWF